MFDVIRVYYFVVPWVSLNLHIASNKVMTIFFFPPSLKGPFSTINFIMVEILTGSVKNILNTVFSRVV